MVAHYSYQLFCKIIIVTQISRGSYFPRIYGSMFDLYTHCDSQNHHKSAVFFFFRTVVINTLQECFNTNSQCNQFHPLKNNYKSGLEITVQGVQGGEGSLEFSFGSLKFLQGVQHILFPYKTSLGSFRRCNGAPWIKS